MFTGLIEETGRLVHLSQNAKAWKLRITAEQVLEDIRVGDSIACNGCCLTAVALEEGSVVFDVLDETLQRTTFQHTQPDSLVNLERSLKADTRFGGHFVTGHIDAVGNVTHCEKRGTDCYLRIEPPPDLLRYTPLKGSIAVDGISLTIAEIDKTGFAVWLIPHTLQMTNLHERHKGDKVNLEFDLLAKYTEQLLRKGGKKDAA